jgi:hypothetical protein
MNDYSKNFKSFFIDNSNFWLGISFFYAVLRKEFSVVSPHSSHFKTLFNVKKNIASLSIASKNSFTRKFDYQKPEKAFRKLMESFPIFEGSLVGTNCTIIAAARFNL